MRGRGENKERTVSRFEFFFQLSKEQMRAGERERDVVRRAG